MERESAIDREKVIKALETCRKTDCAKCEYNTEVCLIDEIISDALALLKEQEDTINELQNAYGYLQKLFFEAQDKLLKEQETVEPFHRCIGKKFSLIENSHFDYCPYCGKPITWAKQEGR